jgi:hypothetical protein
MDGRVEPTDGPSIEYQASGVLDPRYSPANKDSQQIGLFPSWLNNPYFVLTDNIPSSAGTATLATATTNTAVSGTALQFITVAPGSATSGNPSVTPGVPLVPFQGTAANKVTVLALDFGFTNGNTTASNVTVTSLPDSSLFYVGQWICIGGAGNSTKTAAQICQIASIPSSSTITVNPAPLGTLTGAPIGSANSYGQFPPQNSATGVTPYWSAGESLMFNPTEAVCRGISISGVTAGGGTTFAVVGYDTYGVIMHENIVQTGGATTAYSKKAYKYLASVTPLGTDAHNYTIGTSDLYGINVRSDKWEYLNVFWNGSFLTGPSTSGWTQALQASAQPSSATAADVRGTIQTSSTGPSATGMSSTASNGTTVRLAIMMSLPLWNDTFATPSNTVPLLGYTQF